MRIISKFHDYYDSAMGYGQDPTLIYKRETVEYLDKVKGAHFTLDKNNPNIGRLTTHIENALYGTGWNESLKVYTNEYRRYGRNYADFSIPTSFMVLFCGKVYVGFEFCAGLAPKREDMEDWTLEMGFEPNIFCYTIEQADKFIKSLKNKKIEKIWAQEGKTQWNRVSFRKRIEMRLNISFGDENKDTIALHQHYNCPVILITVDRGPDRLIVNPCLKNWGFQRKVDPFTAFQEISMFTGGVLLRNTPKMVEIGNEDKIHKAGFDKRSSFRHPVK